MIVNAGLLIDFGNSETRVVVISGNKSFKYNMSNKFAELPAGYRIPTKYVNEKSNIFGIDGSYYANGYIVEREFARVEVRPSALQSKVDQLVTELTINLAVIKALSVLSQAYNVAPSSLDVTFNISALLPPLDHEVNEQRLLDKIKSINNVTTLVPAQFQTQFKVGDVMVNSEAVAAFFGAFYREVGGAQPTYNGEVLVRDSSQAVELVEVEENKKFMNGYVLVLDIGAGTTDVALFKDMELIERSKDTFKLGGNTVASIISNDLKKRYGFTPNNMKRVITEGLLEEGSEVHPVEDIVTAAKDHYSKSLMEEIRQYLERIMVDMPVIKGLLVAGGGALPSIRDGQEVSPAMARVLMGYLNTLAPKMEPLNTEGKDLRDLNIDGLMFIHKYA